MSQTPSRIVFMGTPAFAVPSLLALLDASALCQVVGVVTQPDRPAGRGRKLTPSPVKQAAQNAGLPVLDALRFRSAQTMAQLRQWAPHLIVVAAFGRILPKDMLELPPLGCLNLHASLLPRHRGASPIARAIWAGDTTTGICLMRMDEGLDTGDVFARAPIAIDERDTCGSLTQSLSELAAKLLRTHLQALLRGELVAQVQPQEGITHAPPLCKADGLLDFACSAQELARTIRALDPWPGTYSFCGEERIGILAARPHALVASADGLDVGELQLHETLGPLVRCKKSVLLLERVKPAGRGVMDAAAWLRGRPQRPLRLGSLTP